MNKILTTIRMDADIKDALTKLCKGPYNQTYVIDQALRAYQPLKGVLHAPAGMGKHKMSDLPKESKLGANIVNSEQKQNINWINPWDLCVGDQITLADGSKVTVTDKKPKAVKNRFVKPYLGELRDYFHHLGVLTDVATSESFIDHYNANGWKVGKTAMKDWKAAARNWKVVSHEGNNNE